MKITKNEGPVDRAIRVVVGIAALAFGYLKLQGALQIVAYVVGVAGLATGIFGFCGLYTILGINTCAVKKQ